MTEKDLENKLMQSVRKAGGRAYKFISPGNSGVPDRLVVLSDRPVIFIEMKRKGGRLTQLQKIQIERLRDLGQDVRVICGETELDTFLQKEGL